MVNINDDSNSLFRLDNMSYSASGKKILSDITHSISSGRITLVTGPSGSGKTTFLKLLGSLLSTSSGNLFYRDQPIDDFDPIDYRSKVLLIGQKPFLIDGTVRDNMLIPFELKVNKDKNHNDEEFNSYLNLFGLGKNFLGTDSAKLSGGEGQRVALARGFALKPETLLLDEPTSALDLASENRVVQYLNAIKNDTSLIIVTHSPSYLKVADNVIILKDGIIVKCKDMLTAAEFEECLEKEE